MISTSFYQLYTSGSSRARHVHAAGRRRRFLRHSRSQSLRSVRSAVGSSTRDVHEGTTRVHEMEFKKEAAWLWVRECFCARSRLSPPQSFLQWGLDSTLGKNRALVITYRSLCGIESAPVFFLLDYPGAFTTT